MTSPNVETTNRCAECLGPLPVRRDQLAVIHGPDGELIACSTACLTGLVVALAGRPMQPDAGRRN